MSDLAAGLYELCAECLGEDPEGCPSCWETGLVPHRCSVEDEE